MTNLATRIQTQIAQDRAMLAEGTQGKWKVDRTHIYTGDSMIPIIAGTGLLTWQNEKDNMALIAACVNEKEGELLVIEGLLEIVTGCLVCEGTGISKVKGTGESGHRQWTDAPCLRCVMPIAILTRWIEGREAMDEKG